jgi:hypothetical protein
MEINMFLFKTPVKNNNKWDARKPPIYVVAKNKKDAIAYVQKYIKAGHYVDSAFCLGEQMSGVLFSGANKSC